MQEPVNLAWRSGSPMDSGQPAWDVASGSAALRVRAGEPNSQDAANLARGCGTAAPGGAAAASAPRSAPVRVARGSRPQETGSLARPAGTARRQGAPSPGAARLAATAESAQMKPQETANAARGAAKLGARGVPVARALRGVRAGRTCQPSTRDLTNTGWAMAACLHKDERPAECASVGGSADVRLLELQDAASAAWASATSEESGSAAAAAVADAPQGVSQQMVQTPASPGDCKSILGLVDALATSRHLKELPELP